MLATAFGNGQLVGNLVRVSENSTGTAAFLQIDQDGTANGSIFTTIAQIDGIHAGDSLKVILDSSLPPATATLTAPVPLRGVSFDGDICHLLYVDYNCNVFWCLGNCSIMYEG